MCRSATFTGSSGFNAAREGWTAVAFPPPEYLPLILGLERETAGGSGRFTDRSAFPLTGFPWTGATTGGSSARENDGLTEQTLPATNADGVVAAF